MYAIIRNVCWKNFPWLGFLFCVKSLQPSWVCMSVLSPRGLSTDVSCLHISNTGCKWSKVWHSESRQAMVGVHPQKPHSWSKNQDIACLQMPDAEFCVCKVFLKAFCLPENSLGAEIQLLLHWQGFLMYEEDLSWAGKTSLSSCDPSPMLAFHWVILSCSKLSILGRGVALGTENPWILQWALVTSAGMRISLVPSMRDGAVVFMVLRSQTCRFVLFKSRQLIPFANG